MHHLVPSSTDHAGKHPCTSAIGGLTAPAPSNKSLSQVTVTGLAREQALFERGVVREMVCGMVCAMVVSRNMSVCGMVCGVLCGEVCVGVSVSLMWSVCLQSKLARRYFLRGYFFPALIDVAEDNRVAVCT